MSAVASGGVSGSDVGGRAGGRVEGGDVGSASPETKLHAKVAISSIEKSKKILDLDRLSLNNI
jgi:hypothetical protein